MLQVGSIKENPSSGEEKAAGTSESLRTSAIFPWNVGITHKSLHYVVLFCCDIVEAKHFTCILPGTNVGRAFVMCLVVLNDNQSLRTAHVKPVVDNCSTEGCCWNNGLRNEVKNIFASHDTLEHLDVSVEMDAIKITSKFHRRYHDNFRGTPFWWMLVLLKKEHIQAYNTFLVLTDYVISTCKSQSCWKNVQWRF